MELVGKGLNRVDGWEKVTGQALYAIDMKLAGMLHAKVLRSPYPHARILNIDTNRAERLSGVRAIATGKEGLLKASGLAVMDRHYLEPDKVRFIGDPVVAVAATSEDVAAEALALINVAYEPLDPAFDPLKAMEDGAPLVHENLGRYQHAPNVHPVGGTNICEHFKLRKGDVEWGFAQSDLVVERQYWCQKAQHCPLETHSAIAKTDAAGKVTVWTSTQAPYMIRSYLCQGLGLPSNKVRVIAPYCGGGFGAKSQACVEPICALLSLKTGGRPVRLVWTREEEFIDSAVRHPCIINVKTGIKNDGRLLAAEVKVLWDTGAYALTGPFMTQKAGFSATGPYQIPHAKIDSYCVYTNSSPAGAFRGFGHPQISFAMESHMDTMAAALGIDPLEIRLLNGVEEGSVSVTGEVLHSVGLKQALKEAARSIGWNGSKGAEVGRGIACSYRATAINTSSSALVKVDDDGAASIMCSTCELGQGSKTILTQIAAEELGIKYDEVTTVFPDTDITPFDYGTISSRSTFFMGNAVRLAAAEAKDRLLEMAAEKLEASIRDLEIKNSKAYVKGSPETGLSIRELFLPGKSGAKRGYVLGRGFYSTPGEKGPDRNTGQSNRPTTFWIYDAQAIEVEVDRETGEVTVLRVCSANEVGKAINPENCYAQVHGCLGFGIGGALFEELVTEQGKVLNPSFADYHLLTAVDMPPLVTSLIEEPHKEGPYGAKGSGEGAGAPTAAAIANAIYDALGVRITDHLITPEKVLAALKRGTHSASGEIKG